uniref:(northern house mosquito) hypothetical protein n=1 Tax=Culex pipiens TaxID=7175 RepID=A0A8D8JI75_CULPI
MTTSLPASICIGGFQRLTRPCSWHKYSLRHRVQKSCSMRCIVWNLSSRFIGIADKSTSGTACSDDCTRKCAGVNGSRSLGSSDIGVSGLELRQPSTWTSNVLRSSAVTGVSPIVFNNSFFVDLTAASQRPPKCGALGGLKCHLIPWFEHSLETMSRCLRSLSSNRSSAILLRAPTKFVPLSE